jgi:hypothetical protein
LVFPLGVKPCVCSLRAADEFGATNEASVAPAPEPSVDVLMYETETVLCQSPHVPPHPSL